MSISWVKSILTEFNISVYDLHLRLSAEITANFKFEFLDHKK